jgi:signal transduction histidine kinase
VQGRSLRLPRAARGALIAVSVGTALTLLVALWPTLGAAYRGRELRVASETAGALVALVAGFLMVGRFLRRRRLDDLLLAMALVVFALVDLVFLALPAIFAGGGGDRVSVWSALVGRIVGATALAAAALGLPRRLRQRRVTVVAAVVPGAVVVAVALFVSLLASWLPQPVEVLPGGGSRGARLIGHPAVLAAQLVTMTLFGVAAVGLVRRAARERDGFLSWLAAASVLAAFARLHYFLYPSLYTDWVYSGDLLRLLFHATVLTAAALEVRGYWRSQVEAAVLEERRRLARDLHDGLAQELAYIKRNLQWLDDSDDVVVRLRASSERAVIESRRAVAALAEPSDRPLHAVLAEAVQDVATRERIRAIVDVDETATATPEEREGLVRIACEAVTNAARHGGSNLVRVELSAGDLLRLRISDAGVGFDPDAPPAPGRFGLTSMRGRALALGAGFKLSSSPGQGTEVDVEL